MVGNGPMQRPRRSPPPSLLPKLKAATFLPIPNSLVDFYTGLISTAPLAQIAAVDACGLSTQFPVQKSSSQSLVTLRGCSKWTLPVWITVRSFHRGIYLTGGSLKRRRFPHRSYAKVPRADADETRRHCNGGWRPLDIHLGGGAYLYLLEFLLLPLAAEARLCDAAPYRPAAESDLAREVLPKFVRSMRYSPGCVDPATGVLKPRATRARHCGVPREDGYG